jgi:hypothetical protein
MVELFSFVKTLEEDWTAVMKGVAISYGSQKVKDVGVSMGFPAKRKRKHESANDGRAPDTTDALSLSKTKKVKLGRPLNSANFDKNQYSTYPSYHAISSAKNPLRANRCWLAAALETLYAVFSPCGLGVSMAQETTSFPISFSISPPEQHMN